MLKLTCNLDEGNYKQLLVLGTHEIEWWKPIIQHRHGAWDMYVKKLLAGCQNIWCYTRNFSSICVAQFSKIHVDTVKAF
jgi:hypothetical protein